MVGVVAERDVEDEHEARVSGIACAGSALEQQDRASRPNTTAAIAARVAAERQVGGRISRSRRSCAASSFSVALRSAAVGLRPVRPRASIDAGRVAAVLATPLLLRLRHGGFRLGLRALDPAAVVDERVLDGAAVADRDVGGEAVERGRAGRARRARSRATRACRATAATSRARGTATVVLDVRADLGDAVAGGQRQAERADARQALARRPRGSRAAIARASSSVAGGGELDVERDQRRPRARRARRRCAGRSRAGPKSGASSPAATRSISARIPPRRSSARVRPPASAP